MRLLPTKEELISKAIPYSIALGCVCALWMLHSAPETRLVESTKIVVQTQVKEVVKYVEVEKKSSHHVEITKPDGTRIVSTTTSELGRKEASSTVEKRETVQVDQKKEEVKAYVARYNLGASIDINKRVGIHGGIRLGDLPLFIQLYAVPSEMSAAIGIQIQF